MEITTRLAHLTTPTEALAAPREQAPSGSVWLLASSYRCPKLPWLSVGERKATPSDLQVVRQRVNAESKGAQTAAMTRTRVPVRDVATQGRFGPSRPGAAGLGGGAPDCTAGCLQTVT